MRGLPNFSTHEDVINAIGLYPYSARKKLESLYNDRYTWVQTGELKSKDAGTVDATHIVSEDMNGGFVQMEKVVDNNAAIYRLGFTDDEVKALLTDIESYKDE